MKRYVLLDRDGTLIVDRHYLADPDGVELLPGVVEGLHCLTSLGVGLIVVTNQSGVGRGYFDLAAVQAVNDRLRSLLAREGVFLDDVRVCPHHPADDCPCRKPKPGMVLAAACELGFDLQECFVIGDQDCDVELGRSLGAVAVRLGATSRRDSFDTSPRSDYEANDLAEAACVLAKLLASASSHGC